LPPDRTLDVAVRMGPAGYVSVVVGKKVLLSAYEPVASGTLTVGGTSDRFTTAHLLPAETGACDRLRHLELAAGR
jgi:hypothetical protein